MALWHRPKLCAIPYLRAAGCDRVATLLRRRGLAREEALERIGEMRPVTRSALTPAHLEWGDKTVNGERADV